MSVVRRFLVLPALARLIRKERGGSRVTEGYFAPQGGRTSLVRIDGQQCHLVLINAAAGGGASEERTEVPRGHGDALLDVCSGKAVYERTTLGLGAGPDALIDRYVTPKGLDLISVSFENEETSKGFRAPSWFGPEVSDNAAYERHAIALQGVPEAPKMGLNNAMLDAVLDLVEPRFGLGRFGGMSSAPRSVDAGATNPRPSTETAAVPVPLPPAAWPAPQPSAAASQSASSRPSSETSPKSAATETASSDASDSSKPAAAATPTQEASTTSADAKSEGAKPPTPGASEPKLSAFEPQADGAKGDARIDDVIESLSQALGAAIQQPQAPSKSDELAASFERWTVRPRRTQQ